MKYMLLIYSAEDAWTPETRQACLVESLGICEQLAAQGKLLTASPLSSVSTATTVRVRQGQAHFTTGPFAETVEQLGGFYLLELDHLDEAITIAGRLPPTRKGTVEIRPVWPLEGLPAAHFHRIQEPAANLQPFLLLCYDDEVHWQGVGPAVHRAAMDEAAAITHELAAAGKYISAAPLHPIATATSVRVRAGQRHVSDGPFAETREVLGGYYLILAHNQTEAAAVAARHPGARVGAVEVRALQDLSQVRPSAEPVASSAEVCGT